jgi:hypothetical protein
MISNSDRVSMLSSLMSRNLKSRSESKGSSFIIFVVIAWYVLYIQYRAVGLGLAVRDSSAVGLGLASPVLYIDQRLIVQETEGAEELGDGSHVLVVSHKASDLPMEYVGEDLGISSPLDSVKVEGAHNIRRYSLQKLQIKARLGLLGARTELPRPIGGEGEVVPVPDVLEMDSLCVEVFGGLAHPVGIL